MSLARTEETYREQFAGSAADLTLPPGFVRFHSKAFSKFLEWSPEEFQGKRILDTGSGPGKHAAVLATLGADVTAVDLLPVNAESIERLARRNGLEHLRALQADLMQALPESIGAVDAVTAHNWLQHTADPAAVLLNIVAPLRMGGRLYLSVYQGGTFRFFVAQIARQILRWEDRRVVLRLIPLFFPEGFDEFGNPDDIYFENILDDDFVPYMWTFRYEPLARFLKEAGFDPLVPHSGQAMRHRIDNEPLKASFVKVRTLIRPAVSLDLSIDEFVPSVDVDAEERAILERSAALARDAVMRLQSSAPDEAPIRAAFALGLYRIRGRYSRQADVRTRHAALQAFLERYVTGDEGTIRGYQTSKRAYPGA